jgi:Double zinc ribbon
MDQDQRDPRDWPEGGPPEDATDEPLSEEAPAPPPEEPAGEPDPAATDDATPAEPEPPAEPAAGEPAAEPAASETESWPAGDAAPASDAPAESTETRPWPTEPPEAGEAEEGTWPTSAPERGDEAAAGASEPEWPSAETTDAGAAPTTPPAEVEAETDESAWPAAGAAAGAAGADAPDAGAEPPPGEAEAYPTAAAASVAAAGAAAQTVPDAEAATGESTQCPRCGTENRPGLAFCRSCGQRLVAAGVATTVERPGTPDGTMACPRCGTHNRSGVAFCQNCGANLRGTAPGYVPPAVAATAAQESTAASTGGAVLGPVVLIIGLIGLITGYLLPFAYGDDSLFDRAFGSGGYGIAFWSAYPSDAGLADTLYFGLAAPVPILAALLAILAVAGFIRARPGSLQVPGLVIALAWSVGLIVLFLVVEVFGNLSGDLVGMLRQLSPGGIILFLASLIVLIGTLTRFGRS